MKNNRAGFTIVELMIATAIFTIILIITTTTIIGITQTYIKGSVENQTEDTATSILNEISQDIEFNNGSTINTSYLYTDSNGVITPIQNSVNEYYFCIGNDVYVYSFDFPLNTSDPTEAYNIGLVRYSATSCPTSLTGLPNTLSNMPTGYEELLVQNERIGALYIQGQTINSTATYTVKVEVGYASNSANTLISDNSAYQNGHTVPPANYTYPYQCLSGTDSSFCAVTDLTTMVAPRIND